MAEINSKLWFSYMLVSLNAKYLNQTYIGVTTDLNRRLDEHNGIISTSKITKSTVYRRPFKYQCVAQYFQTRGDAQKFEYKIKNTSKYKNGNLDKKIEAFTTTNITDKISYPITYIKY